MTSFEHLKNLHRNVPRPGVFQQVEAELISQAEKHGLQVCGMGNSRHFAHYKIFGKGVVINYYPFSHNKTAYMAGSKDKGRRNVTAEEAVLMAVELAPPQQLNMALPAVEEAVPSMEEALQLDPPWEAQKPEPAKPYRLLVTVESTQGNGMNTFVLKFGSKEAALAASRSISASYARHYELVITHLPEE